ncbi:MAG: MFS transporter [Gammaproteobacteria bacterium]|nr:MFS transporter [Gammaproteobacteria bacterium]
MSMTRPVVNVDTVLDGVRFQGLPLLVLIFAVLILVLDGFDIQIIGFAAPALTQEFGIERKALGPVLAAGLLGMALGAFAGGQAGDRFGRRPTLIASMALVGAATLAAAATDSLAGLTWWRLLTGIGLGGTLPNATALMAEFAPPRWRSQAIAVTIVGVPIGGMIGAAIAAEIIPAFGWRVLFVVGAALPLALAAVMYFVLPESARFLTTRAQRHGELVALLGRIFPDRSWSADSQFVLAAPAETAAAGLRTLFTRPFLRDTLGAWLAFLTNIFVVYAFFNWIAVVLTSVDLDIATAVRASLVFNLAGVVGAMGNAWVIARYGSRWPLTAMALLAAAALFWLARLPLGGAASFALLPPLLAGIAVAGLAINAVQIGMYAVVAHVYPTACRSSGVGWALGVGRLGGILSSFAGGLLLARGSSHDFFGGIGLVMLLAGIGVLLIHNHLPAQDRQRHG